jgi:hypothetical protein
VTLELRLADSLGLVVDTDRMAANLGSATRDVGAAAEIVDRVLRSRR